MGRGATMEGLAQYMAMRQAAGDLRADSTPAALAEAFFSLTSSYVMYRMVLGADAETSTPSGSSSSSSVRQGEQGDEQGVGRSGVSWTCAGGAVSGDVAPSRSAEHDDGSWHEQGTGGLRDEVGLHD